HLTLYPPFAYVLEYVIQSIGYNRPTQDIPRLRCGTPYVTMHRNLHSVGKEMSRAKNVAEKIPLTQPVEDWLRALARQHSISKGAHDVIQAAILRPEFASYASAFDLGKDAGVNTATVTRAAQALGFSGWPELRQEIRARYVGL